MSRVYHETTVIYNAHSKYLSAYKLNHAQVIELTEVDFISGIKQGLKFCTPNQSILCYLKELESL